MKKRINILFALSLLVVASFSCVKKEGLTAAEQSVADEETIQTYLKNHKLDSTATHPSNHINWTIVEAKSGDETLADIAKKDTVFIGGVQFYTYFIEIEEGKSADTGESKDLIIVDYNEFLLSGEELTTSAKKEDAIELELSSRIEGIRHGIKSFFTGEIPDGVLDINYRKDIEVPGRGIIIFPSGLGYGSLGGDKLAPNQPLRVDLVLYDKDDFPEEEKNSN